jgi:membrane protein involved in colicin uptake
MKSATTSIAMRSALTAAKIGLSLNTTPALQKYFDRYEKRIEAVEVKEKAEAEAKEKAEREKAEAEAKEKAEREKAEKSSAAKKAPKEPELSPADKK